MKAKRIVLGAMLSVACMGLIQRPSSKDEKRVIGPTETVEIADASIGLIGRVDTGARTTSLHAEAIKVDESTVSFVLVGPDGQRVPMSKPVATTAMVRSAAGSEERVFVELTLQHGGLAKPVLVNLKDRSHMNYPLLLGRNWLKDDYVVDISQAPMPAPRPTELAVRD